MRPRGPRPGCGLSAQGYERLAGLGASLGVHRHALPLSELLAEGGRTGDALAQCDGLFAKLRWVDGTCTAEQELALRKRWSLPSTAA